MSSLKLTASNVSLILIGMLVLVFSGLVYGGYLGQAFLQSEMEATVKLREDASKSSENLNKAQTLKAYVESHQVEISSAARLVAESKTYQYQNQIVADITNYANKAGVTILGFDFPASLAPNVAPKTATSGLKSIKAIISLQNPVPYTNYLQFLKYIEQNLTRMQVTDIDLTADDKNPGNVNNPSVGLEVYVR